MAGEGVGPELVEVFSGFGGEPGAHLEAVGLHEVEGADESVKSGEDAKFFLGGIEVFGGPFGKGEALVDVAGEGEDGLAAVLFGGVFFPAGVAVVV